MSGKRARQLRRGAYVWPYTKAQQASRYKQAKRQWTRQRKEPTP